MGSFLGLSEIPARRSSLVLPSFDEPVALCGIILSIMNRAEPKVPRKFEMPFVGYLSLDLASADSALLTTAPPNMVC